MRNNILILLLGFIFLLRLPFVDFTLEVENSLPFSLPLVDQLRATLVENTKTLLPSPQAGLLLGMTIGVKDEIPYNYNQVLKKVGIVHVVVVSGQNLTLVAGFVLNLAPFLGRKKTTLLSMAVVCFYLFLTGFQIPVIRAAIMFGMSSLGKLLGREGDDLRVLSITALAMLIYNPLWVISISFQLSFAATVGVVVVAPKLVNWVKFVPQGLKEDLLVTVAAQILTAPIIAFHFSQFSVAGFFVNALVLWTIPLIMISGAAVLLISLINHGVAQILAIIPGIFLTYFVDIIALFNKPWASRYIDQFSIVQLIGIYATLASIYAILYKKTATQNDLKKVSQETLSCRRG